MARAIAHDEQGRLLPQAGHGDGDIHDHGHDDHGGEHPTSTGLNNVKVLMWTFIASECLLFGSLISTYLAVEGRTIPNTPGPELFDIPYTSVSAFFLLFSSLSMVLALAGLQAGDQRQLRIWLFVTAALGLVFLGGQYYEFSTFYFEEFWLDKNFLGSSFFLLTGFHGAHVTVGVIWLLALWLYSLRYGIAPEKSLLVEISGLYWHFVDVVWIVIFAVVYLIPYSRIEGGGH